MKFLALILSIGVVMSASVSINTQTSKIGPAVGGLIRKATPKNSY
jgi:hypothetical protein